MQNTDSNWFMQNTFLLGIVLPSKNRNKAKAKSPKTSHDRRKLYQNNEVNLFRQHMVNDINDDGDDDDNEAYPGGKA